MTILGRAMPHTAERQARHGLGHRDSGGTRARKHGK